MSHIAGPESSVKDPPPHKEKKRAWGESTQSWGRGGREGGRGRIGVLQYLKLMRVRRFQVYWEWRFKLQIPFPRFKMSLAWNDAALSASCTWSNSAATAAIEVPGGIASLPSIISLRTPQLKILQGALSFLESLKCSGDKKDPGKHCQHSIDLG